MAEGAGRLVPADPCAEWDRILPGVTEALRHQKEGLRPEDVYCELKLRRAFLFVGDDGFVILKEHDHHGVKDLLIWLAYSRAQEPVMARYAGEVDRIARDAGCAGIQFVSTRRGYERALPQGWEALHVRYRRVLT